MTIFYNAQAEIIQWLKLLYTTPQKVSQSIMYVLYFRQPSSGLGQADYATNN
jgi:hypothetical protein